MTRATWVRAVIALAVLAASLALTLTKPAKLGLDLRGGTQIVLETQDAPGIKADQNATDRTLEVLRKRVDALGVSEPELARSGDRRIIVELPGVQDPREAMKVLGRTAQLSFHQVEGNATPEEAEEARKAEKSKADGKNGQSKDGQDTDGQSKDGESAKQDDAAKGGQDKAGEKSARNDKAAEDDKKGEAKDVQVLPDESGQYLRLGPAKLTGGGVEKAEAQLDTESGGGWFVSLDLRGQGKKDWQKLTGEAACSPAGDPQRRVAIVLDGKVISSPQVDPSVGCGAGIAGGSTQITGSFSQQEADDLALLISGGALPVPVDAVEQRTVGPTLGAAAIEASAEAAIIGVILTSLFIIFVYRLFGGLAAIALACYGLISYAALLALDATLTLPGLAGFVLAIGMAVDANVLVFERAREEYASRRKKTLRSPLDAGYRNALSAIVDSNITTLLAAVLLFFLASGPVRGFGVTLSIGVIASMISALLITRVLTEIASNRRSVRRRPKITGIASEGRIRTWVTRRNFNLVRNASRRQKWIAFSLASMLLVGSGIFVRGLDYGVEFTGGRVVEYSTSTTVDADVAREAVADAGFPRAVVQATGDKEISVRTEKLSNAEEVKVGEALSKVGGETEKVRDELIGPSLGNELRQNALIALGVALLAQLIYLAVRFRWTFGTASVLAMAHDVVILVGVFAWLGKPIDGVFLAALLTVVGYSINDSVVVFDRVRELWAKHRGTPFEQVINDALLQTMPRTVNTGMGATFILAALAVLGGDSLTDFAIALLIGLTVGTYSSVFTASPIAVELEHRRGTDARRSGSSAQERQPSGKRSKVPEAGRV
ncbi:protein translocase subunit SecD [Streptomyces sp. TP-A0874]|uniref:protein translocase subunit SecD n=1 Tax=Streptomyces sp. TP-A0874 TaxID=549819 RepID=UPI0009A089ED|nr:protein translocase subunit SecD [Streptomyces sp. TP-A0874]